MVRQHRKKDERFAAEVVEVVHDVGTNHERFVQLLATFSEVPTTAENFEVELLRGEAIHLLISFDPSVDSVLTWAGRCCFELRPYDQLFVNYPNTDEVTIDVSLDFEVM
jgi:hypothetical protein